MKNFTFSLYGFHLRHTLTDAPDEVVVDANLLWENLAKLGEKLLPFPGLRDLRSKLICYQNSQYDPKREQGRQTEWLTDSGKLDLGSIPTAEGFKIQGNLQPFRLNDTYAADLTLSPESPNISIDVPQLKHFNPGCLLPSSIQASLGQTLWLYGEVDASEDCQVLAKKCAVALLAGTPLNPVLANQDKLFGSLLFEYQATDPDDPQNPAKQSHILVCLNNNKAPTLQLAGKAYDWLRDLLCCRHKILYVYQEARNRYPDARKLYSQLEKQMQDFPSLISDPKTRLEKLKELLIKMPQDAVDYSRCLRDLKAHYTAISTNIINYRTNLEKITAMGDSPKFWEDFLNRTCHQWQTQIQIDIEYLSPAQDLFQQMIDTIRGMVEIDAEEQAQVREQQDKERDRNLQTTIAVVGVGIGFTGLAAASFPYLIPPDPKTTPIPLQPPFTSGSLHPFIWVLLLSLVFGFLGAGVAKGVTMLISSRSDKRAKLKSSTKNQLLNQANTPEVGQVTGVQQKVEIPTQPPRK